MSNQRYLVAARKYRPKLFKEIVAQEHVTDTLQNAIRLDRLAHAYLFSGPRGVGKTTAARVLAKAINCTTPPEEREDRAEPCRSCASCRAFEDGRSLNIFEIDAASNNKVDDIRELRETVRIPPQGSKKKVYIIDEVHMLSKQAFNALLKTLEEPPSHTLFIFATTEPHKVLPTILSRCQRFDFRRIPVPDVLERLRDICEAEDITADEESLMLIAKKGDGALRDALSAFDQAVSLCGAELQYAELTQAMGVVDLDLFFQLTEHLTAQHSAGVLRLVEHVVREGYDLHEFLAGLAEHLRNLLVARILEDDALIEAAAATRRRYAAASRHFSESDLLRLLMIVGDAEDTIKGSSQPRLKLEMALLKMASMTRSVDLRRALQKIDRLERMVENGELPAEGGSAPPVSDGSPPASAAEPASDYELSSPPTEQQMESTEAGETASASDPSVSAQSADVNEEDEASPDSEAASDDVPTEDETVSPRSKRSVPDTETPRPQPDDARPQTGYRDLFGTPALGRRKEDARDETSRNRADGASASLPPPGDDSVATAAAPQAAVTTTEEVQGLPSVWLDFVRSVTQARIRVGSCLQHATPVQVQNGIAQVAVPDAFHRRQLIEHEDLLLDHLTSALDQTVERFRFVVQENASPDASGETTPESDPYQRMRRLRAKYPVIDALFEDFGGELAW